MKGFILKTLNFNNVLNFTISQTLVFMPFTHNDFV